VDVVDKKEKGEFYERKNRLLGERMLRGGHSKARGELHRLRGLLVQRTENQDQENHKRSRRKREYLSANQRRGESNPLTFDRKKKVSETKSGEKGWGEG